MQTAMKRTTSFQRIFDGPIASNNRVTGTTRTRKAMMKPCNSRTSSIWTSSPPINSANSILTARTSRNRRRKMPWQPTKLGKQSRDANAAVTIDSRLKFVCDYAILHDICVASSALPPCAFRSFELMSPISASLPHESEIVTKKPPQKMRIPNMSQPERSPFEPVTRNIEAQKMSNQPRPGVVLRNLKSLFRNSKSQKLIAIRKPKALQNQKEHRLTSGRKRSPSRG